MKNKRNRQAVSQAKQADVAIVVLGGGQRTCGENKSRSSLDLPGRQLDLTKSSSGYGKACRVGSYQRTSTI